MFLQKLPIGRKLTLVIFFAIMIVLLMVFAVTINWNVRAIRKSSLESAKSAVQVFSQDFTKILVFDSPHIAADTVSRLEATPSIKSAVLFNSTGKPVFFYQSKTAQKLPVPQVKAPQSYFDDKCLNIYAPVTYEGANYGTVYYRISTSLLTSTLLNYKYSIAVFIIIAIAISALISYRIQRMISRPIVNLANILNRVVSENNFALRAHTEEGSEIGQLYNNFNHMIGNIEQQQQELQTEHRELEKYRDHLEQLVDERTRELAEYTRELESFSYSVSHDLRAPLRAINGFSAVLNEDYGATLDDDAKDMLKRIVASSNHMGELIDDILQLSRINQHAIAKQNINLSEIALEVAVERTGPNTNMESASVSITPNIKVIADPKLMRIVMDNLIGNALKYSAKCEKPHVDIGVKYGNGATIIYVKDNGVGFDMQYVDKLFAPFERLHSPQEYDGTGIGLATVKRVVQRHGGEVWAVSEMEQGATFYFSLPQGILKTDSASQSARQQKASVT